MTEKNPMPVIGGTINQSYVTHLHAYRPAGMRKVPRWQFVDEQWEALLVCECGHMEWRRAPQGWASLTEPSDDR